MSHDPKYDARALLDRGWQALDGGDVWRHEQFPDTNFNYESASKAEEMIVQVEGQIDHYGTKERLREIELNLDAIGDWFLKLEQKWSAVRETVDAFMKKKGSAADVTEAMDAYELEWKEETPFEFDDELEIT